MNKQEFLDRLGAELSGLPQDDMAEHLSFFGEMIDDRIEEGLSEEDAVTEIGPVDTIAAQIAAETPLLRLVRETIKPKQRLRAWEIVLLVLGSPIWLSLLIAAFAVLLSVDIVIWAVIVSLWAVMASFAVSAVGGAVAGILLLWRGDGLPGLAMICAAMILAGLSIFLFFGCRAATGGAASLTKKIALWIKSLFLGKERKK